MENHLEGVEPRLATWRIEPAAHGLGVSAASPREATAGEERLLPSQDFLAVSAVAEVVGTLASR